jgi:serine phosphatase RsbU (regulator of sigma subunit)
MSDDLEQALQCIEKLWYRGASSSSLTTVSPDHQQRLARLLADLCAVQSFASGLSRGDLSRTLAGKGVTAGALKQLHASLRHLTWQTQMVAKGDFSQHIDFMGEFAVAFNSMARSLAEARAALQKEKERVEQQNAQLAQHGRELQAAYDALDREFKSVADVQVSLLPTTLPKLPGFRCATHYRPALRAGGDYYDFFPLPEGQFGVLVADVSGHGAPAAVVMAMTHVIVHLAGRKSPVQEVLQYLNAALSRHILSDQFVTCCYGILNPAARTFVYASAGHPMPLLETPGTPARICSADCGFPLGITPDSEYAPATLSLAPQSALLLYTDGITEAQGPTGEMFGEERLAAVLADAARGPDAVRAAVLEALDAHRGPVDLADDITLVVLCAD